MKRLLILSSKPPYPLYSGSIIRTYQIAKLFSENYKVDVLYITSDYKEETDVELSKFCNKVIPFKVKDWMLYSNVLKGTISSSLPMHANIYYFKFVQDWIDKNISVYDAVLCCSLRMTEYVRGYNNVVKWVDFVDSMALKFENMNLDINPIWRWAYDINTKRSRKYESFLNIEFNKCITISDLDKDYILSRSNAKDNISVISNYIDIHEKTIEHVKNNNKIVFLGCMDYEPNITAVKYFVKEVLPLVKNKVPDARFYIVGIRPTKEIWDLAIDEEIIVTGFVEDPDEFLFSSAIFVAPMRTGAGLQNKVLQAMTLGACVVTTSIGAEGLNNVNGAIVIEDTSPGMARKIAYYLDNHEERNVIGQKAKQYIISHMSKERIKEKVLEFCDRD